MSLGFAVNETSIFQKPKGKILLGIVSFLIFVAGMGLVARLNMKHSEAFPLWTRLKVGIWILINLSLLFLLKIKETKLKKLLAAAILCSGMVAVWVAINKPV